MKKILLLLAMGLTHPVLGVMSHHVSTQKDTRQLIIHFASDPRDRDEHKKWNHAIYEVKEQLNKFLLQENYLKPLKQKKSKSAIQNICNTVKEWCYSFVFREFSSKYPHRKNEVFFTRIDHDFGNFALYIPDGISESIVIEQLKYILNQQGVAFHIDKDIAVHIAQKPDIGLEGVALTLQELEAIKRARHTAQTKEDAVLLDALEKKTKNLATIKDQIFWHHRIPTTGLRLEAPFYPPSYPYIPHMFSLWQLAPKKGRGIKVAIIDTGVSAASFKGNPQFKKNDDLTLSQEMLHESLNIVSHNGLDPIEQLVNLTYPYINPQKFNEVEMSQEVITWVYEYLKNQSTDKIIAYLKSNGKKELFDSKGQLSSKGKQAVNDITTGPYGIAPHEGEAPMQFATMQEPYNVQVVEQLLPIAPISDQNVTYISGHGSHTYGLVAGLYQGKGTTDMTPEDDIGICGLAPEASTFMIKAFKDDGTSDKSTLVAGLKKAILYNADIASLSLKIADNMDVTASLSKLLEKMVDLIPYVVAASGNGGDPQLRNYVGKVEAYPARFDLVEFDVGSFGFKDMKCPINTFSQYEPNIGPKFVAPGFNIISSALVPGQKEDSMYVFMDGTSMATPLMTGFVALMLAEFQQDFSRDEMLNVCYTSAFHMHNDSDWQQKVLLGALDMRTALFILHVLRQARKELSLKNLSFNRLLTAIQEIIYAPVRSYGKKELHDADFTGDYMTYLSRALENKLRYEQNSFFKPQNLEDAIRYVINSLLVAYTDKKMSGTYAEQDVLQSVAETLKAKKDPDIFDHMQKNIKDRILTAEKQEDYWQKQANRVRNELIERKDTKEVK